MPTEIEHVDKWRHNRAFLAHIDAAFSDWRATAAFYSALHAVEAFLWAKFKRDCYSHEQRDPVVQAHMTPVYSDYYQLYSISRVARYMIHQGQRGPLFDKFLPPSKVVNELIKKRLHNLEQFVIRELVLPPEQFPELFPPPP